MLHRGAVVRGNAIGLGSGRRSNRVGREPTDLPLRSGSRLAPLRLAVVESQRHCTGCARLHELADEPRLLADRHGLREHLARTGEVAAVTKTSAEPEQCRERRLGSARG